MLPFFTIVSLLILLHSFNGRVTVHTLLLKLTLTMMAYMIISIGREGSIQVPRKVKSRILNRFINLVMALFLITLFMILIVIHTQIC